MAIKLADTLEPMANFPVAYSEHILFEDDETLQEKFDNGSLGGGAGYIQLSQAEYDALSDDEKMNGKEYHTYDTGHIYKLGVQYGNDIDDTTTSEDKTWSSKKIKEEIPTTHYLTGSNTEGYFKIRPIFSNDNKVITITDKSGGCIEIYGSEDSGYPINYYKAVRLSFGNINSYDASSSKSYRMEKLYIGADKYFYLKVLQQCYVSVAGTREKPEFLPASSVNTTNFTEIPIVSLIEINDDVTGADTTWSSEKIADELTHSFDNLTDEQKAELKGDKGDKGDTGAKGSTGTRGSMWYSGTAITGTSTTATIFSSSGVSSALVNDMYLNTSTQNVYKCTTAGNASTAKWVYVGCIKGATGSNGTTPTIKASAGSNIGSVGTPSVSASTSGTTTTFTFNYLKGAKGDKGDKGDTGATGDKGDKGDKGYTKFPSSAGSVTGQGTICSLDNGKVVVLFCIGTGGGSLKATTYPSSGLTFNNSAWTSGTKAISVGSVYTIANTSGSTTTIQAVNNGGGGFLVFGPM